MALAMAAIKQRTILRACRLIVADLFVGEKVVGQVRYWFFCQEPKFGGKKCFSQSLNHLKQELVYHKPRSFRRFLAYDFLKKTKVLNGEDQAGEP